MWWCPRDVCILSSDIFGLPYFFLPSIPCLRKKSFYFDHCNFLNIALTKNKPKESLQVVFVVYLCMVLHKRWCSTYLGMSNALFTLITRLSTYVVFVAHKAPCSFFSFFFFGCKNQRWKVTTLDQTLHVNWELHWHLQASRKQFPT